MHVADPDMHVHCATGARARSGDARTPSRFGREHASGESVRVSETRPSKNPDPRGLQAGACKLSHSSVPCSDLVLPSAESSKETGVPYAQIVNFSKNNVDCQMNSTDKSVQFSS